MLHLVLYILLAIIVAVGLFLLATRFLPAGEQIAPPIRDEPVWELPAERTLQAEDVDALRLPVALRGYRFAETDVLLDRLAGELRARDAEIDRLRRTQGAPEPAEPTDPADPAEPTAPAESAEPAEPADSAEPVTPAGNAAHTDYAPPRPRPATAAHPDVGPGTDPGVDD